jgi:hypothetical protein
MATTTGTHGQKEAVAGNSARGYSTRARQKAAEVMHEMKNGKLKSGTSGKTVENPKEAVAIGLSEARRVGEKVPPKKGDK